MMLTGVKTYLCTYKLASLAELARHFNADPDFVRSMLQHWIQKGYVNKTILSPSCGTGCSQCHHLASEIYRWIGKKA